MAFVSLISCRVAQFLTDHGQVAIHGPGGWGRLHFLGSSWAEKDFFLYLNTGFIVQSKVLDVNQIYCGDNFIKYINIELRTPETITTCQLSVNTIT